MTEIEKISSGLALLRKQRQELGERIAKGEKLLQAKKLERDNLIYNPVIEKGVRCKSDYACFNAGEYSFYYGYESLDYHPLLASESEDECKKTWAFEVFKNDKEVYKKAILPEHVEWNCLAGLLAGIGYWLESEKP